MTTTNTDAADLAKYEATIRAAGYPRRGSKREGTKKTDKSDHVVYVLSNNRDEVMYVGISLHAITRFGEHSGNSWWKEVSHIELTHFSNRADALARELELIKRLSPPLNTAGKPV